jgi:hypothetical protein
MFIVGAAKYDAIHIKSTPTISNFTPLNDLPQKIVAMPQIINKNPKK